jgi:ribosome biogenesis GTPase
MSQRRKGPREKDLTERYLSGNLDEDRVDASQRFSARNKSAEQDKILRTARMRAEEQAEQLDPETLPLGRVLQVYSLYCVVEHDAVRYLCVVRKTLSRISDSAIVVGDAVRFRPIPAEGDLRPPTESPDSPEGVIEAVLPRRTVLTRADSFKGIQQHPIVANADQMLIVVALAQPRPKWGLVDRMIVAAQSGGLTPIVCLNKMDLAATDKSGLRESARADEAVDYYASALNLSVVRTSAPDHATAEMLREILRNKVTVLAGHSGVGKSSLINSIEPTLDLRVGEISHYTEKGRHTTTSARSFPLSFGGTVIDTPGVKLFGLWGITPETLPNFFPDVQSNTAPPWRRESYERISESLFDAE